MAWIELHQAIWTHRKTLLLAAELDLDETYAASHLIRLWTWALDNAPEGDLSGLPARVIAFGSGWKGDPEAFVKAAIKAGWLDREGESLFIHDWQDYAGRLIDKRRQDAERKRKHRGGNKDVRRTSSGQDADYPRDGAGTVPNQTVPNHDLNLEDDSVDAAAGESSNSGADEKEAAATTPAANDDLLNAFEKELEKRLTPLEAETIRGFVDKCGPDLAREALRRGVAAGNRSLRYIDGIIQDWSNRGFKSLDEALAYEQQHKERRRPPPKKDKYQGLYDPPVVAPAGKKDKYRDLYRS